MPRILGTVILLWASLWTCLWATPLSAGAWPRAAGSGFASLSLWQSGPFSAVPGRYTALYVEYGATPRLTFGLDAGRGVSGATKTVVFLRRPLLTWREHILTAEIGLGQIAGQPVLRPGLSYGTGFQTRHGSGWLAVDTLLELGIDTGETDFKTDITVGFTPAATLTSWLWPDDATPPRLTGMLQLQAGSAADAPAFLRLAPSVTYRLRGNTRLEIGAFRSLRGPVEAGLKLGIWTEF